eukprot:sb/3476018/
MCFNNCCPVRACFHQSRWTNNERRLCLSAEPQGNSLSRLLHSAVLSGLRVGPITNPPPSPRVGPMQQGTTSQWRPIHNVRGVPALLENSTPSTQSSRAIIRCVDVQRGAELLNSCAFEQER